MVSNPRQSAVMQYQMAGADNRIKACKEEKLAQPLHQERTRKNTVIGPVLLKHFTAQRSKQRTCRWKALGAQRGEDA